MPTERDPNYPLCGGGEDEVQHPLGQPVGLVELQKMPATINDGP
jgi:hypothetical protein